MKRQTQWIAIMLLTGAVGVTTGWADSFSGERLTFEREWEDGRPMLSDREIVTTSSRPAWVVKEDRIRPQELRRSGYVVVEPARELRQAPVAEREEIILEPVAEKHAKTKPMRHIIIRERLAPVADGPIFSGPATIKERRVIRRTVHYNKKSPPAVKERVVRVSRSNSNNQCELAPVGERVKYTVKRTAKRTGDGLGNLMERTGRSFERFGRALVGAPEPVAERVYTVQPIYERDTIDTRWDSSQPDFIDYGNPYR